MRRFGREALALVASIAVASGCGGSRGQMPGPPVSAAAEGPASQQPNVRGDLLYVAHIHGLRDRHTVVSMLTLPLGKPVAKISVGYLSGMCSDASGNVWLVVWHAHPHGYYLEEYAHGGTQPIAQIRIPRGVIGGGCAVDPSSGDLAAINEVGGNRTLNGSIDVWAGARAGKPTAYDVPFVPENGAYDDNGNLFFDGRPAGSDPGFRFGELAKGSGAVAAIGIDKKTALAGGVLWDGTYVAVQTGGYQPFLKGRPRIYRIESVSGSGHVIGIVVPRDPALRGTAWFALYGHSVVSISERNRIDVWPYPAGGRRTRIIGRFGNIRGLTISVAP